MSSEIMTAVTFLRQMRALLAKEGFVIASLERDSNGEIECSYAFDGVLHDLYAPTIEEVVQQIFTEVV